MESSLPKRRSTQDCNQRYSVTWHQLMVFANGVDRETCLRLWMADLGSTQDEIAVWANVRIDMREREYRWCDIFVQNGGTSARSSTKQPTLLLGRCCHRTRPYSVALVRIRIGLFLRWDTTTSTQLDEKMCRLVAVRDAMNWITSLISSSSIAEDRDFWGAMF